MPVIEKRYASALADICEETSSFNQTIEEFKAFMDMFNSNPELNFLLLSHGIKNQIKKETLNLIKPIDERIKNLIFLLLDKGRIEILPEIYEEFIKIANAKNSILNIKIFSANNLETESIERIKEIYRLKHNKSSVNAEVYVDKTLLGGVKIQIGDTVIDSTLKGRFDDIAKKLTVH
jgi:F-type H+-transporting ATPase subunit delta